MLDGVWPEKTGREGGKGIDRADKQGREKKNVNRKKSESCYKAAE